MAIATYLLMIGELGVERELLASAAFVKPQISRVCKFVRPVRFPLWARNLTLKASGFTSSPAQLE